MKYYDSNRKELIILTEHFAPSIGATSQLVTDLAEDLDRRGVRLRVLTSTTGFFDCSYPVHRFSGSGRVGAGVLQKVINGLVFFCGSTLWLLVNIRRHQSLFIVSNPPFLGLIGVLLSIVKRTRYVFLLQDVFPRSASLTGILPAQGPLINIWNWLLKAVLIRSETTIVLSPSMIRRCCIDYATDTPLISIPNWAVFLPHVKSKNQSELASTWGLTTTFTIQYSGNFGRLHEILTILEAARLLQDHSVTFVFVGDGAKLLQIVKYCQVYDLKNVLIKPYQKRTLLSDSIAACDISAVSLIPGAEDTVAPSKLYGILASSRPVLLIASKNSEIAKLITQAKCGVIVEPGDPQSLCQTILSLKDDYQLVSQMAINARNLYDSEYGRERSTSAYYQLLLRHAMI